MNLETRVKVFEMTYAGALADSVYHYTKAGILEQVTEEKRKVQLATGKQQAAQLGIAQAEEVFLKLAELFNCTQWQITETESGFIAEASACKLCAFAKKMGSGSPCRMYCLNPMEGMVKGLEPECTYTVEETLWEGAKCRVAVHRCR